MEITFSVYPDSEDHKDKKAKAIMRDGVVQSIKLLFKAGKGYFAHFYNDACAEFDIQYPQYSSN